MSKLSLGSGKLSAKRLLRDALYIIVGSLIYAVGIDGFEVPNGLAAGGLTGLATIFYAIAKSYGIYLPVGLQTIAMNVILLAIVVASTRDWSYVALSIAGILISGFFTDALAPFIPNLSKGDLLLSALLGGVLVGVGIGLVFRSGGNTGGTDIIAQFFSRATGIPVGTSSIIVDGTIVAVSIPVFSVNHALYAAIAMYIGGRVIDVVIDGPRTQRAAYIVSLRHEEIANAIMYDLGRGVTELQARGVWSGNNRPVLFCVLGRSEVLRLKDIVAHADPEAIVIISEVHEAFGQGFRQIES